MTRSDLYSLIDTIPESKLPVVRAYLEGVRDGFKTKKESFRSEVEAGIKELDKGERIPHDKVEDEIERWLQS